MGVIETLLAWLAAHTYEVVFVGALIDATGLPFPGRLILAAAGGLSEPQGLSVAAVIALGAAGAMITDHVWYFAGRLGSDRLLRLYCRLSVSSSRCERTTTDYFQRYGALTIVIGRFVAGVRLLAWPLAARSGIGYPRFLAYDLAGALLWSATWVLLGWFFADTWRAAAGDAGTVLGVAAAAAVILIAAVLTFRLRRRHRHGATWLARGQPVVH
jgi:membrane protein DedA with SNARE-associated domain